MHLLEFNCVFKSRCRECILGECAFTYLILVIANEQTLNSYSTVEIAHMTDLHLSFPRTV
jgi:hypothetical protein